MKVNKSQVRERHAEEKKQLKSIIIYSNPILLRLESDTKYLRALLIQELNFTAGTGLNVEYFFPHKG